MSEWENGKGVCEHKLHKLADQTIKNSQIERIEEEDYIFPCESGTVVLL